MCVFVWIIFRMAPPLFHPFLQKEKSHCRHVYASFLKGQGHQVIFSLGKGTLLGNCKFLLSAFQGHQGNRLGCLRVVSGLSLRYLNIIISYRTKEWCLVAPYGNFSQNRMVFLLVFFLVLS